MDKLMKQLVTFTLILLFTSLTSGCQAKEEIAQNNIVSIVEKTGGRTDINKDGRVETILIEKDEKLPGIIKKLVILNDNGEPIFYLAIRDVPKETGAKNNLAIYAGVKHLEREENNINRIYYEEYYSIPRHPRHEELSPKVKQKIEEEKAWAESLSPSGKVDLDSFEKRVERLLAKETVLYRSGAISGGGNIYGYRVTAGVGSRGRQASLTILTADSEGKSNVEARQFIWDTKTNSYMDSWDYLQREHPNLEI